MTDELRVTDLLRDWRHGNEAAFNKLETYLEKELRKIARGSLRGESRKPFQTTDLLQETYRVIIGPNMVDWDSRRHFFRAATSAMRHILVDVARKRKTIRHGEGMERVGMFEEFGARFDDPDTVIAIHDALKALKQIDPEAEQIVVLRFFNGYSVAEAADIMGVSKPTADRRWAFARAWLYNHLSSGNTTDLERF